ncbi:MAG: hypothetical protein V4608_11440 [Bacteroidota bacterium]
MRIYITTFFLIFIGSVAIAGSNGNNKEKENKRLITGKVIDKISGEEIAGAKISINDKIIYSDLNGNFMASIQTGKTEALITSVSYNDVKVNIDSHNFGEILVELESN